MYHFETIKGLLDGLRPIQRITVSEWADKYRYLSPVSSAEPGKYKTERTPYMRKIMDALSYRTSYKKVIFMKSAQTGGSEAAVNFIGYIIHICPAPVMMVQPNVDMYKKISQNRIDPLIETCPELKVRVSEKKSRSSSNTVSQKTFNGGVLYMSGANSAASLRSVPVRFLILDEVDAYLENVDNEGSPIDLAIARTETFQNRKIFIISTPTVTGASVIESEFLETEQNYFHVPCPHCNGFQRLVFEQLQWEANKPETAKYYCIHCGAAIDEIHKTEMLKNGIWKPEYPELASTNVTGFHISALYAPIGLGASWKELADSYLKVKDDVNKFRTFVNTKLGETWAERGEAPPYKNIYNRRENYPLNVVPDDVCFLTAGVDVQHNRLELEIVGWCADKRSYSIDYRVLDGNPAETEIWQKLTNVLNERFLRADGLEYPIRMMAIDSGDNTSHVYAYCRQFSTQRVIPIKGQDSLGMAISPPMQNRVNKAGKRIGNIAVWNIGVSFLKVELYANLHLEKDSDGTPPPNYCHFPEYPEHYFRGLTAEEQVTKIIRGYRKTQWVKTYARNEPLDCRIYARAAASVVGLDKMTQKQLKNMVKAPVAKAAPRPVNQVAKQEAVRYIPETPKQETRKVRSIWNR